MIQNSAHPNKKLSTLQFFFWPVFPEERKLVLLLSAFMFLAWGAGSLTYPFQQSFLMMAPNSGTEVIGFLRTFLILPIGIFFIIVYNILHHKLGAQRVITAFYIFFIFFYLIYAFYIVPRNASLTPSSYQVALLMQDFPRLKWLFSLYGNWTYSLFYVVSYVWATVSYSQLFWQTANHFTSTAQASRVYALYVAFSGLGGVVFALLFQLLVIYAEFLGFQPSIERSIFLFQIVSILNVVLSILIILTAREIYKSFSLPSHNPKTKEKHISTPSVFAGFKYLFHSPYLLLMFSMIASYNMVYQLMNLLWNSELRQFAGTTAYYNVFLARYEIWTGIAVIIFAYLSKTFIHKWGWLSAALMSPLVSLIAAIPFFSIFLIYQVSPNLISSYTHPNYLLAILGAIQNIIMGASIACLSYPTKEMAYIPLNHELKFKGKIATDILAINGALAISGLLQEVLLSWTERDDLSLIPYFIFLIFGCLLSWVIATKALGKRYFNLIQIKSQTIPREIPI